MPKAQSKSPISIAAGLLRFYVVKTANHYGRPLTTLRVTVSQEEIARIEESDHDRCLVRLKDGSDFIITASYNLAVEAWRRARLVRSKE